MTSVFDGISEIFVEVFEVSREDAQNLEYEAVPGWDSIGHMMMVSALEEKFGISLELDEIIGISNFETCVKAVESKIARSE